MKALVTGATGFVGSHLVERLLAGGMEVVCLLRRTSDPAWLAGLPVEKRTAALEEPDALRQAVAGCDYVFHVAGLTRARTARQYLAVNAEGTRRLVEAVADRAPSVRRFVYVSSLAAVGPNPSAEPLDEAAQPHPIDAYGRSKLAGERIVLAAADRLPVTIVRPPAVYGPRDRNVLPLFRAARRLGRVPIVGKASKQATFVHAADLARGIALAAASPAAVGKTYFLGSGTYTMADVVAAVAATLGIRPRRLAIPALLARLAGEIGELKWALTGRSQIVSRRKVRDMLQPRWTCSWARARDELGYREQVGLADGMRQTADWYADRGWLAGGRPGG